MLFIPFLIQTKKTNFSSLFAREPQEYLAQLVDRTPRSIMYMENRGQHPSLHIFFKIVILLDISVDKFFYPDKHNGEDEHRKHIDTLLNGMKENELIIVESTAEGIRKARERSET